MPQLVLWDTGDRIGTLTLNRPERHNSLIPEMLRELLAHLDAAREQKGLAALVLQANGRSFSTGGDVGVFYEHGRTVEELAAYASEIVGLLNQAILAMVQFPVPIVAAVQGIVTGGSLGLVLASDIVLLAPAASFTPFYTVVGFSPDGGWTALLPTVIGTKRAAEALFTNRTISAEEAVHWGLANQIVPTDRLPDEARAMAEAIAEKRPGSTASAKRLLWGPTSALAAYLEDERRAFVAQIITEEARAGIGAFLRKRRD